MKIGGDELICMVAGKKHRDMLIWGRTIINFEEPSWEMRYRFAKPGQAYVDSAPGGRRLPPVKSGLIEKLDNQNLLELNRQTWQMAQSFRIFTFYFAEKDPLDGRLTGCEYQPHPGHHGNHFG